MNNGLKILVFGTLGFLGFRALSGKNSSNNPSDGGNPGEGTKLPDTEPTPTPAPSPAPSYVPRSNDSFPLKRGSTGEMVKNWQSLMKTYAMLKNLPILKTDPLDVDGIFGPQSERWSVSLVRTSIVKIETYNWLYNEINKLKGFSNKSNNSSAFKVGDHLYTKGERKFNRYRATELVIKSGTLILVPTFEQFVAFLKLGKVNPAIDMVDFSHGEYVGRVAQVSGTKLRVVVSDKTNKRSWWLNPLQTHRDYFTLTQDQVFK